MSLLATCLSSSMPGEAGAQEYQVDRRATNVVRFISRASIEEFEGTTSRIDGYVLLEPPGLAAAGPSDASTMYFEVDLASLDTGIGLRNRHMRDNYLEVGTHPFASFEGKISERVPVENGGYRVTASGTFTVHGVEKERELTCRVDPRGSGLRAQCAFEVLLTDHGIEIPKVMFLKLANEIRLELDFTVAPVGSPNGGVS
jgi:polyisoprenoid-binding protein YceI